MHRDGALFAGLSLVVAFLPAMSVFSALLAVWSWVTILIAAVIIAIALVVRPWDGDTNREHKLCLSTPYTGFWLASWIYTTAERIAATKPAPMRVAELANAFVPSQVLFSLVSLGIPGALVSGPKTAAEVAVCIGPDTNVEWLDRLMMAAASKGMLNRSKISTATLQCASAAGADAAAAHAAAKTGKESAIASGDCDVTARQDQDGRGRGAAPAASAHHTASSTVNQYSLNAVSAALTTQSPVNMASFVSMMEDHYMPFAKLAEGIRSGNVPYQLHTGGQGFWEWSNSDPNRAARFDMAMLAVNHYGGSAVVNTYSWGQFDCVVDVAGGVGGFMADLMTKVPQLKHGVVFDLAQNIQRAKKLWSSSYPHLLPRVELVPGDMFDAATVPSPPADSSCTAYVLRNILHDWPDAECINILKAIRSSVARAQANGGAGGRVRLLIVEVTTSEEVLPCHLRHRCCSDLVMMVSFGDGKERNTQQFDSLFAAAGWRLLRITPTSGVFMVVEAEPL